MVKPEIKILIRTGAMVTNLTSGKTFLSEHELVADLIQFKLEFAYYSHHNSIYRVPRVDVTVKSTQEVLV